MTVNVILEGTLKEGKRENFTGICTEAFKVTRAFDGCQGIELIYNTESPNNWIFNEVWDTKEHYEKYLQFRTEDGTIDAIASLCVDAPSIRIFDIIST